MVQDWPRSLGPCLSKHPILSQCFYEAIAVTGDNGVGISNVSDLGRTLWMGNIIWIATRGVTVYGQLGICLPLL
jgi:hypothetical protein